MIHHFKKIKSNNLLKIFSLTGLSTLIKLITSYVMVKILATVVGPSGIALIGQLQNFTAILTTFGAGGINNGVVKYVAEHKQDQLSLRQVIGNGFKITLYLSLFVGIVICILSKYLSNIILLNEDYYYVFILFGLSLFFLSINNFFISVLNGFKEFRKFVFISIITNIIGLIFTIILVFLFSIKGALIANVTYQSVVVFFTIFYIRKLDWFSSFFLWNKWNKKIIRQYGSYSLMAIISAITIPVVQLLIRKFLINEFSINEAGFWESMNKISGLYLILFTSTFSVYYLPKLSEIKDQQILKNEIFKTYKIFTPLLFMSLAAMFFSKELIINLLFTKDFYFVKKLFLWQLLGDFFKIMSWILAFLMIAKSMTKIYIITEIFFSLLYLVLTYFCVQQYGLIGASKAYFFNYFIYFVVMLVIFRNLLFKKNV